MNNVICMIIAQIIIAICWYLIGYNNGKKDGIFEGMLKKATLKAIEIKDGEENIELEELINKILDEGKKKDD